MYQKSLINKVFYAIIFNMYIKISALKGQKQDTIQDLGNGRFLVSVREKPEQNQANRKILQLVAEYFKIDSNKIRFISGHQKPSKIVSIPD